MRGNAHRVSGTKLTSDSSGVWSIDEHMLHVDQLTPKAYKKAGGSFRRCHDAAVKSLLHFDYPYPGDPGDGLRDEIGTVEWSRIGTPTWVGTQTPNDGVVTGTPKFGYRCMQCNAVTDYITAPNDTATGPFSLRSNGAYEVELFFRPKALTSLASLFDLRAAGGASLFAVGHNASGKLTVTSSSAWGNLSLTETSQKLVVSTWSHLVLRIRDRAVTLFADQSPVLTGTLPANATLPVYGVRVGQCLGQIDEFRFRHTASKDLPVTPTQPYAASIDLSTLGGFGNAAQGNLNLTTGTTQLNTYASVSSYSVGTNTLTLAASISQGLCGALAVGNEVMIHASLPITGRTEFGQLGRYALRRITAVNGTSVTLDTPVADATELNLTAAMADCFVQLIKVPNYYVASIAAGATVSPLTWDGRKGGLVAFKTTESCSVYGKILATGTGPDRGEGMVLTHSDLADRFVLTGNVWIVCGGTFTTDASARIGATWDGSVGGPIAGGTAGPASAGSGLGGAGGLRGASVALFTRRAQVTQASISCGGQGGTKGGNGGNGGTGGSGYGGGGGGGGGYTSYSVGGVGGTGGVGMGGGGGGGGSNTVGRYGGNPLTDGGTNEAPVNGNGGAGGAGGKGNRGGTGGSSGNGSYGNGSGGVSGGSPTAEGGDSRVDFTSPHSGMGGGGGGGGVGGSGGSGNNTYNPNPGVGGGGGGGGGTGFCMICTTSFDSVDNTLAVEPIRYAQCTFLAY